MSNKEYTDTSGIWERQKGEGDKAYEYFTVYRDLGASRSLRKVAKLVGIATKSIHNHSIKWKWRERVKAWYDELDRIRRDVIVKEVQEMTKRHAQQSMMLQRVLIVPTEAIIEKLKMQTPDVQEFKNLPIDKLFDKVLDSARVISQVVDIERKSRGEPSEILKTDVTGSAQQIKIILPPAVNKQIEEGEFSEIDNTPDDDYLLEEHNDN